MNWNYELQIMICKLLNCKFRTADYDLQLMYFIYFIHLMYWIHLTYLINFIYFTHLMYWIYLIDLITHNNRRRSRASPCVVFAVVCDQVNQVDPVHQVNEVDEVHQLHQVDPVHQVDEVDEGHQVDPAAHQVYTFA